MDSTPGIVADAWMPMQKSDNVERAHLLVEMARLAEQRGWGAREVEARENAQRSLTDKVSRADGVVDNSGAPEQVERQVEALLRTLGVGDRPAAAATAR